MERGVYGQIYRGSHPHVRLAHPNWDGTGGGRVSEGKNKFVYVKWASHCLGLSSKRHFPPEETVFGFGWGGWVGLGWGSARSAPPPPPAPADKHIPGPPPPAQPTKGMGREGVV